MLSPNPKVWRPEIENVESKTLRSRSVIITIDASPHFGQKGMGGATIVIGGDIVPNNLEWEEQCGTRKFIRHKLRPQNLVLQFQRPSRPLDYVMGGIALAKKLRPANYRRWGQVHPKIRPFWCFGSLTIPRASGIYQEQELERSETF